MQIWTRFLVALVMAVAFALPACGDDSNAGDGGGSGTHTGIVTNVESEGLNEVSSFTLKSGDETFEILIDESVTYGFPLGHLEEHRVSAAPVEVEVEERDGDLYALSIVDVEE